jgi:HK97 family phage major capsid protein
MKKQSMAFAMIASALITGMAAAEAGVTRGIVSVRADIDVKATVEALNTAFAAFKTEHTKQLDDIKKGQADSFQALKVDQINSNIADLQAAVDAANTKMAAVEMGGVDARPVKDKEYSAAFKAHMQRGDIQASMNKNTAAEGGYLAPVEWDRTITDRLLRMSPMRGIASVQTISGAGFSKLFSNRGTTSGWVGETAARPQTNTSTFSQLTYTTGEIYANPAATQGMLDDAEINLEAWLAGEVETEFAYQEGLAFLSGDGVNKPRGILTYVAGGTGAAIHPWGAIATVNSGAAGAVTAAGLIDLVYELPNEYTGDAKFMMNRNTQKAFRKLVDGQGNFLWQPSAQAGQPATLSGYNIIDMPGMPDVAANSTPVLFGDFKRGYLIIDRTGVRVLRDPFTNKPFVQFYTTKRVGGGLQNPDVLKALKIAAA